MGFFDSGPSKKVSGQEFDDIRKNLANHGFNERERDKVKEIFRGDMDEDGSYKGIDSQEAAKTLKWMEENKNVHGLSQQKIDILKEQINKHL